MAEPFDNEVTPGEPDIPLLDEVVAPEAPTQPDQPTNPMPSAPELDIEAARAALKQRLEVELRQLVEGTVCAAAERAAASLEQLLRHEVCPSLEQRLAQLVDAAIADALPIDQSPTDTPSTR